MHVSIYQSLLNFVAGSFSKPALKSTPKPSYSSDPDAKGDKNDSASHVFEKPKLRQTRLSMSPAADDKQESNSETNFFEKPVLKVRDRKAESFDDVSEVSHVFEKPVLRSKPVQNSPTGSKSESSVTGTFQKPELKKTRTPFGSEERDLNSKGVFERPALRKTDAKLSREPEREKTPEKPSWLQKAANKQSKVLDVLQAKGIH